VVVGNELIINQLHALSILVHGYQHLTSIPITIHNTSPTL